MACKTCGKRTIRPARTINVDESLAHVEGIEIDNSVYRVQSRMYSVLECSGDSYRFLPGEKVNLVGTLLCKFLQSDPALFIFLMSSEKQKFLELHPSLRGSI